MANFAFFAAFALCLAPALLASEVSDVNGHGHGQGHGHKRGHHKARQHDHDSLFEFERGIPVPGGGADVKTLPQELPFPNRYVFMSAPGPSDPPAPQAGEEPMLLAGTTMQAGLQDMLGGVKALMMGKLLQFGQRMDNLELSHTNLSSTISEKADRAVADSLLSLAGSGRDPARDLLLGSSSGASLGEVASSAADEAEASEIESIAEQLRVASESLAQKVKIAREQRRIAELARKRSEEEANTDSADRPLIDLEELSGKLHILSRECGQKKDADMIDQAEADSGGETQGESELCRALSAHAAAFAEVSRSLEASALNLAADGEELLAALAGSA